MKPPIPSSHIRAWITSSIWLILLALSSYLLSICSLISLELRILSVIVFTMEDTCSILSTSWRFEFSTSFMEESIVFICSPIWVESLVIILTFWPVSVTFSRVSWISLMVSSIESVILLEISSRRISASRIWAEESFVSVLSVRIWSATTANPFPASPALAASMEAFRARRFVWLEILSIFPVSCFTVENSSLKLCRICSTFEESSAMVPAVFTSPSRSVELVSACFSDSVVSATISSIISVTCCTWVLMPEVMLFEDSVRSFNMLLFCVSSFMPSMTTSDPCLFSAASSLTTVIPSITALLEVLTFSTVVMTRCRSALMLSVSAPSDSFR